MADLTLAPPVLAPLPNVVSPRLDLRRFDSTDLDELTALFEHAELWRFPYGRGFTRDETSKFLESQLDEWRTYGFGCWVARTIGNGPIIGYVGLSVPAFLPGVLPAVEVGWRFAPWVWGQGYAVEGGTAALDQAFATLGLSSVCSLPQADNPPSVAVAERLGMTCLREVVVPATDRRGELIALHYEIERAAWLSRRNAGNPSAVT